MASLSNDLTALRKKMDLTIRDMYDSTRIPLDVIEEIESGFIFSPECTRNKTYIRSFVRTYSKALRITDDEITQALDLVDKGAYDGFLARVKEIDTEKFVVPNKNKGESFSPKSTDSEAIPLSSKVGIDYENEYSRPDPTRTHNKSTPPPPNIGSVNWADMGNRFANLPKASLVPIVIVIAVVLLSVGSYFAYKYWQNTSSTSSASVVQPKPVKIPEIPLVPEPVDETPTTTTSETPQEVAPSIEPATISASLPDTIEVLIWAKTDKLEPVRVRTEEGGIQNPYWIEVNQAMRVEFTNTLALRGQYNRMALLFNGHEFTDFNRFKTEDGQFIINRDFFDDEFWLTPLSLDSLKVKPSRIYDRPSFPTN